MCHDWPLKSTTVNLPIRLKGNLKPISSNSQSPKGPRTRIWHCSTDVTNREQIRKYICDVCYRAVKELSGRLIMNSRRLWNSHQRHKFLRVEAAGDILKSYFQGFSRSIFHHEAVLFHQNTRKTGNNAVEMSQAFHDIFTWFESFTDLNLFKYAFSVI